MLCFAELYCSSVRFRDSVSLFIAWIWIVTQNKIKKTFYQGVTEVPWNGLSTSPSEPCPSRILQFRFLSLVFSSAVGTVHNLCCSHGAEGLSKGICMAWVSTVGQEISGFGCVQCPYKPMAYAYWQSTPYISIPVCDWHSVIRTSTELFKP